MLILSVLILLQYSMKYKLYPFLLAFISAIVTNAQVAEVPFVIQDNGHIHLKVKVNDSPNPLEFVFDTGAAADVLEINTAKKLGLKPNYKQEIQGAGGSKSYDLVLHQKLRLSDNIVVNNSSLVLVDFARFHKISDTPFDGIIGYSVLARYVTKIDYQNSKLVFYKSAKDIDLTDYTVVPFEFNRGMRVPQFNASIKLKNGETFSGRILFDSGAGLTLSVNTPYKKKNNLSKKVNKRVISRAENLSGTSTREEIAIESLTIGDFTFNDLTITLSDEKGGVSAYKGYLGILGAKIIKRFHVILDYSNKKIYLKPNTLHNEKFDFPLSGIRLKRKGTSVIIDYVDTYSPAKKLGLQSGDKIISMNGAANKSLRDYKRLLRNEGATIVLKVLTNSNKEKTYTFQLKKLL